MHNPSKLEHVTLVVPVLDLAHVTGTIENLARLRPMLRVDRLDIELCLSDHFTDNIPEQQAQVDRLAQTLNQTNAELESAIPKENK